MDRRLELLQAYYAPLSPATVKLETMQHGFAFLETLTQRGARLDYGELTLQGTLHKYKLSQVSDEQSQLWLTEHLAKRLNVCRYFGPQENAIFAFNLDNNRVENNTEIIPEMAFAIRRLRERLEELGCRPLVIASGRGYHVWTRLAEARPNQVIYDFMMKVAVLIAAELHFMGGDRRRVKFNFYPDPRTENTVSLRLFGSNHAKNRIFSRILDLDRLLDEPESWVEFARHLEVGTVPAATFDLAAEKIRNTSV
ncbi:MAG TPA: hypothetical protein VGL42_17300 [Opitutaceae bacterium]|jgi:hypothetical protein